jgi:phosphohistidine phosphatase
MPGGSSTPVRRQLLLLRHAKSSWDEPGLTDHDRPLAPRGHKALRKIAASVTAAGLAPELVLCSSARRAVQTLEGISAALPTDVPVSVEDGLYAADPQDLLARLHAVDDDVHGVLMIGHNPGMEDLAARLVGHGDRALRGDMSGGFPTAALATLVFTGPWRSLGVGAATLEGFVVPRRL